MTNAGICVNLRESGFLAGTNIGENEHGGFLGVDIKGGEFTV